MDTFVRILNVIVSLYHFFTPNKLRRQPLLWSPFYYSEHFPLVPFNYSSCFWKVIIPFPRAVTLFMILFALNKNTIWINKSRNTRRVFLISLWQSFNNFQTPHKFYETPDFINSLIDFNCLLFSTTNAFVQLFPRTAYERKNDFPWIPAKKKSCYEA